MSKNVKEERLKWIQPIIDREIRIVDVAKVCPHSARSVKRWLKSFREGGIESLEPKSTRPKTCPGETPIRIKERVIELRKETGLCSRKLHWRLLKRGLNIPVSTIGKVLKDEGLTRKYRVKRVKYKYIRAERKPGELVEIDVKYVPGSINGRDYFQYTAIDTASRWRYLRIFDEQSSFHSVLFLKDVIDRFQYKITGIKTDNHSIFTNYCVGTNKRSDMTVKTIHPLDVFCGENGIVHYLIDPGKPAQNGRVERSHREDQRFYDANTFRGIHDLEKKIRVWNEEYNNLEHCGLDGKTPLEMLELFQTESVKSG
ncbi:MAG: IS481 family transposase [Candidatus Paceibacterota bacterium]